MASAGWLDGGEHGHGAERSQQLPDARLDAAKV
jgi:hypothetical protein